MESNLKKYCLILLLLPLISLHLFLPSLFPFFSPSNSSTCILCLYILSPSLCLCSCVCLSKSLAHCTRQFHSGFLSFLFPPLILLFSSFFPSTPVAPSLLPPPFSLVHYFCFIFFFIFSQLRLLFLPLLPLIFFTNVTFAFFFLFLLLF